MIDNKKLLGNDNDIFQIKEVLEKSLDNKWTQEFVYLLRKFFYIEYWSNVEKNERYTIQMIQEVLKKHLDFLDEDNQIEYAIRKEVSRHDALRTIFYKNGRQKILNNVPDYSVIVTKCQNDEEKEIELQKQRKIL